MDLLLSGDQTHPTVIQGKTFSLSARTVQIRSGHSWFRLQQHHGIPAHGRQRPHFFPPGLFRGWRQGYLGRAWPSRNRTARSHSYGTMNELLGIVRAKNISIPGPCPGKRNRDHRRRPGRNFQATRPDPGGHGQSRGPGPEHPGDIAGQHRLEPQGGRDPRTVRGNGAAKRKKPWWTWTPGPWPWARKTRPDTSWSPRPPWDPAASFRQSSGF